MKIQKFFTDLFTTLAKKYKIPYNGNCCDGALQPVGANDDTGDIYYYDSNTNTYVQITTGGAPADPNRSIQFNNSGAFGGDNRFLFTINQAVNLGNNNGIGTYSFSQGFNTNSQGNYSQAQGVGAYSFGEGSHAEGQLTQSNGNYAHAEGGNTTAFGSSAHAEGFYAYAGGDMSHAEGVETYSWGLGAHAEGFQTYANGQYSHTGGIGTYATEIGATIVGKYNSDSGRLFIVGNGVDNDTRSDAFIVDTDLTTVLTPILLGNVNEYADNTAALGGGLSAGMVYRTGDVVKIVH